jgi:hypothetical protein
MLPCVFQKGGVENEVLVSIGGVSLMSCLLLLVRTLNYKELLLAICIFPILLFLGLALQFLIVIVLYGDKTWWLWETKPRIILNCFLFGTIGIGTWIIKAVKQ